MSAPRTRRLVTAGSLSLALVLFTPAAALADHREEHDPQGSPSEQSGERAATSGSGSGSSGSGGTAPAQRGAATSGGDAQDPRGNNGTIKVDGEAFDDGRGNEPHVGCVFELDFYGFDAGDTATITFTGQAPTGGGVLHTERETISTDAAGGGRDRDATLRYSVEQELAELLALAPHPQQGWHVKVAVDVDGAPGGAKQKVFWVDCPQSAALAGTTAGAATGDLTGVGGTEDGLRARAAQQLRGSGALGVAAAADNRLSLSARSTAGQAGTASGQGAAGVSARGAVLPSVLPFTGAQGVVALLALGVSAVGIGALVHRIGRRRTVEIG